MLRLKFFVKTVVVCILWGIGCIGVLTEWIGVVYSLPSSLLRQQGMLFNNTDYR